MIEQRLIVRQATQADSNILRQLSNIHAQQARHVHQPSSGRNADIVEVDAQRFGQLGQVEADAGRNLGQRLAGRLDQLADHAAQRLNHLRTLRRLLLGQQRVTLRIQLGQFARYRAVATAVVPDLATGGGGPCDAGHCLQRIAGGIEQLLVLIAAAPEIPAQLQQRAGGIRQSGQCIGVSAARGGQQRIELALCLGQHLLGRERGQLCTQQDAVEEVLYPGDAGNPCIHGIADTAFNGAEAPGAPRLDLRDARIDVIERASRRAEQLCHQRCSTGPQLCDGFRRPGRRFGMHQREVFLRRVLPPSRHRRRVERIGGLLCPAIDVAHLQGKLGHSTCIDHVAHVTDLRLILGLGCRKQTLQCHRALIFDGGQLLAGSPCGDQALAPVVVILRRLGDRALAVGQAVEVLLPGAGGDVGIDGSHGRGAVFQHLVIGIGYVGQLQQHGDLGAAGFGSGVQRLHQLPHRVARLGDFQAELFKRPRQCVLGNRELVRLGSERADE